jgi:ArsR family transcriptional regulator
MKTIKRSETRSETKCDCQSTSCEDTTRLYADLPEAAELFRALADETRLAILRQLLEHAEVCACDFLACCSVAQPTVSHHLKILREAGLVNTEKRGLWVYYTINKARLERLKALIP